VIDLSRRALMGGSGPTGGEWIWWAAVSAGNDREQDE